MVLLTQKKKKCSGNPNLPLYYFLLYCDSFDFKKCISKIPNVKSSMLL